MSDHLHPTELGMPEPVPVQAPTPVRHVKTPQQRLAELEQQLARAQAEVRKHDTRRKVILGGACMAVIKAGPSDMDRFKALLWEALSTKDRDIVRDLFQ